MRTPSPITLPARLRADAPGSDEPFGFNERLYSAQEVASRLGVSAVSYTHLDVYKRQS